MPRSKFFLIMLLSFITGIGIESFAIISIVVIFWIGLFAIAVLALAWNHDTKRLIIMACMALVCLAGIMRMGYAKRSVADLTLFSHQHVKVLGSVVQDSRFTEKSQIAIVAVKEINTKQVPFKPHISVLLRKYPGYEQGDIIEAQGMFEVKPYNGTISAALLSAHDEKKGHERISALSQWLHSIRRALSAHIDAALPEPHASFMKGLLLGERASMPADLIQEFKQSGTSHIVALSGYNITLVGAFLVEILLILTVPFWLTFWIASGSIILFVLFTGASASLVRAAIMGILILIAAREGRMYQMTNALIFAGVVMLVLNPYLLRFDVGFQLSFLATLGLIYITAPAHRVFSAIEYRLRILIKGKVVSQQKEHRIADGIKKIMSETVAAQLAVLPLIIYLFGGVSVIAPVSNLFVLAAIPITMTFGFFTGVLGFIWQPLSIVCGWIAWALLEYELAVIKFFAHAPFAFMLVSGIGTAFIISCYIIFFAMWWRKKSNTDI